MPTRKEIADGLKKAATSYFLKKGYSCTLEIGISRRGKLKADLLGVTLRGTLVIGEVKSCFEDYRTDRKWQTYLPACNQFVFVVTEETAEKMAYAYPEFRRLGVGVLVLDKTTGYLRSKVPTKYRKMRGSMKREIIIRLAWRAGPISKRTSRRTRVFL